jgi:hypothetical protein
MLGKDSAGVVWGFLMVAGRGLQIGAGREGMEEIPKKSQKLEEIGMPVLDVAVWGDWKRKRVMNLMNEHE